MLSQSLVYVYHRGEKEKGENLLFKKNSKVMFHELTDSDSPSDIHAKSNPNRGTRGGGEFVC